MDEWGEHPLAPAHAIPPVGGYVKPSSAVSDDAATIDKALYAALVLATGYGKPETAKQFDAAREALGRLVAEREELRARLQVNSKEVQTLGAKADLGGARGASSTAACLCCVCGTISPESDWTYWQRWDAEDGPAPAGTEVGADGLGGWRPSEPGEGDPMMRCPVCRWEHRDIDDGSGVYEGTFAEMEAQRAAEADEMAESWAYSLAEVSGGTTPSEPEVGAGVATPRGQKVAAGQTNDKAEGQAQVQVAPGASGSLGGGTTTGSARPPDPDLGPCEVVVNDTRYVREETLFAAMREHDEATAEAEANLAACDRAHAGWRESLARVALLEEALRAAELRHGALLLAINDGDDYGEHVGLQRHRRAVYEGQAEMLALWEAATTPAEEGR